MKKRLLALVLSALLLINAVACNTVHVPENGDGTIENTETGNEEKNEETTDLNAYQSVLNLYRELTSDNQITPETLVERSEQPFFTELYALSVDIDPQKAGYALKDLNGDQTDELILLDDDGVLFAVFTQKSGNAILVDLFSKNNNRGGIETDGVVCKESISKGESWGIRVSKIMENGELDILEFGISNSTLTGGPSKPFLYRNGVEEDVDEQTIDALYAQYSQYISYATPTNTISKLNLNFIHL